MADGHDSDRWDHTALLAMLLFNPHRDTKKQPQPKEYQDFHAVLISKKKRALKKSSKPANLLLAGLGGQSFEVTAETSWVKAQAMSSPVVPQS